MGGGAEGSRFCLSKCGAMAVHTTLRPVTGGVKPKQLKQERVGTSKTMDGNLIIV